jgi:hypothetical protein
MKPENLIKRIHKEVEAMKPETTAEAKSYFTYAWQKRLKRGMAIPTVYYGNTRG